jgi:AraC-like DNA-binding protein
MLDEWPEVGPGSRDMHLEVELGVVLTGRMQRQFAGIELDLGPGDIWFNGIWEPHYGYVSEAPLNLLILHFDPALLANTTFPECPQLNWLAPFTVPPSSRPHGALLAPEELERIVSRLMVHVGTDEPLALVDLRLLSLSFLLTIIRVWGDTRCYTPTSEADASRLEKVLRLVFAQSRLVGVDEAAACCGLSRTGFNSFFQAIMGIRFAKFALHHRLSQAAAELIETEHPVKAIAETWGFTDASHFHRRFQEAYGKTPSEYRRLKGGRRNKY